MEEGQVCGGRAGLQRRVGLRRRDRSAEEGQVCRGGAGLRSRGRSVEEG